MPVPGVSTEGEELSSCPSVDVLVVHKDHHALHVVAHPSFHCVENPRQSRRTAGRNTTRLPHPAAPSGTSPHEAAGSCKVSQDRPRIRGPCLDRAPPQRTRRAPRRWSGFRPRQPAAPHQRALCLCPFLRREQATCEPSVYTRLEITEVEQLRPRLAKPFATIVTEADGGKEAEREHSTSSDVACSRKTTWVETKGLEPSTSTLQRSCAASCATSPVVMTRTIIAARRRTPERSITLGPSQREGSARAPVRNRAASTPVAPSNYP